MSSITDDIDLVVEELLRGHVVGLPTETVYGLAADATQEAAIKKIFVIKARPIAHPLIMHVGKNWDISRWVQNIPDYAKQLMQDFWPGPLTMVFQLKKTAHLSPLITGGQNTLAVRCPNHPKALEVLERLGRPIVAPSANPFGKISPTQAQHVKQDFLQQEFYILDGGACQVGIESTIIDATQAQTYRILRHGMISLVDVQTPCKGLGLNAAPHQIKVSGNLKQHYQPTIPLRYFSKKQQSDIKDLCHLIPNIYVFSFGDVQAQHVYQFPNCPKQAAHDFYHQLRQADRTGVEKILVEMPPQEPQWEGLRDRISRAGTAFSDDGELIKG